MEKKLRSSASRLSNLKKLGLITALTIVYGLFFIPWYPLLGIALTFIGTIIVILIGWYWGIGFGILTGVIFSSLDVYFLHQLETLKHSEDILGFVFGAAGGGVSGWIGNLHRKVREQKEDLQRDNMNLEDEITKRKKAEQKIHNLLQEKSILLKEVHHRIKNNMLSILGLLQLQAETIQHTEAKEALKEAGNRVQSMLVLYNKLFGNSEFKNTSLKHYFETLTEEIIENFPNRDLVTTKITMENIFIDAKIVFNLGIVMNELITNSMKYAFTNREKGEITITGSVTDKYLNIIYQDDGTEIPESINLDSSTGFGFELINMFTSQIGGTVQISRNSGSIFTMVFDLDYASRI